MHRSGMQISSTTQQPLVHIAVEIAAKLLWARSRDVPLPRIFLSISGSASYRCLAVQREPVPNVSTDPKLDVCSKAIATEYAYRLHPVKTISKCPQEWRHVADNRRDAAIDVGIRVVNNRAKRQIGFEARIANLWETYATDCA